MNKPRLARTSSKTKETPVKGRPSVSISVFCRKCGDKRPEREFYPTTSPHLDANGYCPFCKKCHGLIYSNHFNAYQDISRALYETCRDVDFIYREDAVTKVLSRLKEMTDREIQEEGLNVFALYRKFIMSYLDKDERSDGFRFASSDKITKIYDIPDENGIKKEVNTAERARNLEKVWGIGKPLWEYEYLQEDLEKMQKSFECPDYGMELIMKDICHLNLDIEKARREGQSSSTLKLIEARTKLMGEAKMKPIQSNGLEANETVTFGTLLERIENNKPIPKHPDNEMKKYIDTYFVGQIARIENLDDPAVDKMLSDLEEYTIDQTSLKQLFDGEEVSEESDA